LERLPEALARFVSCCSVSREQRARENQLQSDQQKNRHRIKYRKVDAETGEEVDSADIIKGYEVGKGQYIEIQPEELEAIAIESKRTIEIDEFVPKKEIDATAATACSPISVTRESANANVPCRFHFDLRDSALDWREVPGGLSSTNLASRSRARPWRPRPSFTVGPGRRWRNFR
jgi:hypothetical protein